MQTRKHVSILKERGVLKISDLSQKKIGEKRKLFLKKNNPRNPPIFGGFQRLPFLRRLRRFPDFFFR